MTEGGILGPERIFGSLELRQESHVAGALVMVSGLPSAYRAVVQDDAQPTVQIFGGDVAGLLRVALIESFAVNLRLLTEFLIRPTPVRDFGPAAFGVTDWRTTSKRSKIPKLPDLDQRLHAYWDEASSLVVHFGSLRAQPVADDQPP